MRHLDIINLWLQQEVREGKVEVSKVEGIIPALETAHGLAEVRKIAPKLGKDALIICNCSGRGDKDVAQAAKAIFGEDVFG